MRAIFCSVFLFLALPVWPSFGEDVTGIYFSGGLAFQKQLMLDLSVIRMTLGYGSHSSAAPGVTGLRLGVESNFNPNQFVLAPKAGAEIDVLFLTLRGNVADYWAVNKGIHDFRVTPEAGLTFFGMAMFTYGYNIPVAGNRNNLISGSKISLLINFNRDYLKTVFR